MILYCCFYQVFTFVQVLVLAVIVINIDKFTFDKPLQGEF